MPQGFVYILTNPKYDGCVKIGCSNDVYRRVKDLSHQSGVMCPFELYAFCRTDMYKPLERLMHRVLQAKRSVYNREFFDVLPAQALAELRALAAVIFDAEIQAPGEEMSSSSHAPSFRFSMIHLHHGDELIFLPTGDKVTVFEHPADNKVLFNGITYSLSGFCKAFMPAHKRNCKEAYQGPAYFSYNGISLTKLRATYAHAA